MWEVGAEQDLLVPGRVNPSVGGRCRAGLTCAGKSEPEWEVGAEQDDSRQQAINRY